MGRDERVRLFCALQLPLEAVERIHGWQHEHLGRAAAAGALRLVPPESLHITLVFLGSRPARDVPTVIEELRAASAAAAPPTFAVERYRETRSVAMLTLGDDEGRGRALAEPLRERLEELGLARREGRPWLPHITVARFRRAAGLSPPPPNIRSIDVVRSALYRSVLGAGGARYDVLETALLKP